MKRAAFVLAITASLASACTSQPASTAPAATSQSPPPAGGSLQPVTLPDLSAMAAPVQKQLRDQFATLASAKEGGSTSPADLANAYGELGKLLLAAESLTGAEPSLLNAQTLAPAEERWPYYLGHLYKSRGDSAKAAASFERALQARPDDIAVLVWLANVYLDQGRPGQAGPLFAKALSLQPRVLAAQFGLGRAALANRDYNGAVEHLEAALAIDRRATVVHYPLAMAYRALGRTDQAEAHLRQKGDVEVGPPDPLMQDLAESLQSPVAFEKRGDRAIAGQDFPAAVALFRRGLELAPDRLAIRHKLATALSLSGDVRGAVEQFQEVLRRSPDFAEAHYSLGVLLLGSGQVDLAIERFAAATRFDPTYLEARLQLANTLRRRGRIDAALQQYGEVLKFDPRIGEARFGYALSLVRLKRFAPARDFLIEASRLHPDRVEFKDALARLLAAAPDDRVRDGSRAVALAQELLGVVQTPRLRETMAMALAETGRYGEARNWQREAIEGVERAGRRDMAVPMRETLVLYERDKPSRTPWHEDPEWAGS